MLILHASDLQAGKPYRPDRTEALLALARQLDPDLVVISGDLTQRAKKREYAVVQALLERLSAYPVVVTPGNHDVPLYRVWERIFAPYANWRRYVGADLDVVRVLPGAVVVALNSSAPRRAIVSGRIRRRQVELARSAFREAPEGAVRVVVIHHHFLPTPDHAGGRTLPGAPRILSELEAMGVDLVLGGHVHQTHLTTSRALVPGEGPGIPIVTCGTTASWRGRSAEAGVNTLNVVRVDAERIEVTPHRYDESAGRFTPLTSTSFVRPGVPGEHAPAEREVR